MVSCQTTVRAKGSDSRVQLARGHGGAQCSAFGAALIILPKRLLCSCVRAACDASLEYHSVNISQLS
jgi:hypothetical protein